MWKGRVSIESKPFHALPFLLFSHTSHAPIGKRRIRWRASSTTTIAPCSNACPASMSTFISRSMTCCVLVLRSLNKITLTWHPPERAIISPKSRSNVNPVCRPINTFIPSVIPAKAGIQNQSHWIPVYTGMTKENNV